MIAYRAAYRKGDDGWYAARVIDFPSAISQGRTLNRARANLADALQLMAESCILDGQPFPQPDPNASDSEADVIEPIFVDLQTGTKLQTQISRPR
jgi:predicted RNase H-like HicB family nuclease